jgi:transposase
MHYILSFDISKGNSVYCLIDNEKNIIMDATTIIHNKIEFDGLYDSILPYKNMTIVMESTSIYHLPVENYFRSKNLEVIVLNPKLVKQFKDTLKKSKTDKIDCFKIARCFLGISNNFHYKNDDYLKFNPLSRQYFSLTEALVRYKNRYKQLIQIIFPEFELIFQDLYSDLALNFIHDFPHPDLFVNKRIDFLMNYLVKANGTTKVFRFRNKALKLKEIANNSLCYVDSNSFQIDNIIQVIELIQYTKKEIDNLKSKLISSLREKEQFKIINSIPFVSEFTTAIILAEVGDITRFNTWNEFTSFCGIDPVIIQSGKSINYRGSISKTGNKFARTILFNTITTIITASAHSYKDNPILLYFYKKQLEGKHHYTNIIACSTKLCRLIFKLIKSNEIYVRR